MTEARLTWRRKAAYGLPAFALAVVGIPVYVHIPKFYTDVVGVPIAQVGTILFMVRIFDALTDPFLGVVSDRTQTPMGRRRPYILVGSVLLAVSILFLFIPPELSTDQATIWFAASLFALFLFWTLVTVPYEALGPEITSDYNERTSLFAVRDGLLIAGTLAAAAAPALVGALPTVETERQKFFWIAILYAPMLVAFSAWCVYRIRERHPVSGQFAELRARDLQAIRRNRPFLILLVAYTISALGSNLPATLILFYVQYVLQTTNAEFFLLLYFASGILMLPAWIRLAGRFGKKRAWLASMAINTGAFSGVYFLGAGDAWRYGALVVVSGLGFGATLALPSAIQADVIDYDEYLTGRRQEGWYIGIWSVVKKLTAAVGVGAGLTILGAAGYAPGPVQPPAVVETLRILYALVPSVCSAVAFLVALAFPVSRQAHERILECIALRRRGEAPTDPLQCAA
ncbi:MAG: glycoside-pentoside-hexuronide (GPH):cation symporter [Desulfobacteraceae bacterium]|jgi:GPH family glycoside/pentoside/hexuronide:cation symporter|nr:glycoside-pentoside-hexuronide (GPH):cation symporter [Desulfobacteraceae bacterium]